MAIKTRTEALAVLGLSYDASDEMIKTAYRNLAKLYHPDTTTADLAWQYADIAEAYDFLKKDNQASITSSKVLGMSDDRISRYKATKKASRDISRARADDAKRKQKRHEQLAVEAKRIREDRKQDEAHRQEVVEQAMAHIRAIQMADMISNMLSDDDIKL